jgi:MFS family permease
LKAQTSLNWLNFFLADVRDGVGPYLAIFLLAQYKWDPQDIGIALSAMGLATIFFQTPAGAWVDHSKRKLTLICGATLLISLSCVLMTLTQNFALIIFYQILCGSGAALIASAVPAVTLGLVRRGAFSRQMGRNESYNHSGNVVAAILAGGVSRFLGQEYIFYLVALMSLLALATSLTINPALIDNQEAKGCDEEKKSSLKEIFKDKTFLLFSLSMLLFHFANAAMLPMAGQLLARSDPQNSSLYLSACIIVAQLVMIPVSLYSGRFSETKGRKPLLLIALGVLALRGLLYTLADSALYLTAVQSLDGIGAGIFGVISILVIADLTRGSGHYNLAMGALATAVGIGASMSNAVTGFIIQESSFNDAFYFLSALAALGFFIYLFFVPETLTLKGDTYETPRQ